MLSAICLNLGQSKILLSCNGLSHIDIVSANTFNLDMATNLLSGNGLSYSTLQYILRNLLYAIPDKKSMQTIFSNIYDMNPDNH